jgi:putative endonuclease
MNGSFYKGSTNDLVRRFHEHNSGKNRATARFAPWNLIWFTTKSTKAEAVQLERKLKNLSILRTIEFIKKYPVTETIQGLKLHAILVQP